MDFFASRSRWWVGRPVSVGQLDLNFGAKAGVVSSPQFLLLAAGMCYQTWTLSHAQGVAAVALALLPICKKATGQSQFAFNTPPSRHVQVTTTWGTAHFWRSTATLPVSKLCNCTEEASPPRPTVAPPL